MNVLEWPRVELTPTGGPLRGIVTLPGSKSLTNRALLLAGLATGRSRITGALSSDDTRHMATALRQMGVLVEANGETELTVSGDGQLRAPNQPLFLGNAGTATRFLTAAAALANGPVEVDGDDHMRKRPIKPLLEALRSLGIEAVSETGCPPVTVHGQGGFPGEVVTIDGSLSSQYVSALLMIAPCAGHPVEVRLRQGGIGAMGYIDLTLGLMKRFGASIDAMGAGAWRMAPTGYAATDYEVEPDASACTYFWGAEAITGGDIRLAGDPTFTQPDAKAADFIRMFPNMPAIIDGSQMQDAIPTIAVLAAFNATPVRFTGIANLRVKECDRISAVADGLNQIRPGLAWEEGDDLLVMGDPALIGGKTSAFIDTHNDHRIAMSFALAGLVMTGVVIDNPACVSKTFPGYWDTLAGLGVQMRQR